MRTLKTSEAALLLNVSPNTLRAWERRFGYPSPQRSDGGHRRYSHAEVAALRDGLNEGLSISSAISQARSAVRGDTGVLVGALAAFELERADAAMESALALRTIERTVEEVLLPAMREIQDRFGAHSAPYAFALRWCDEWLYRAQRLSRAPERQLRVLVCDATDYAPDITRSLLRALELFLGRAGVAVTVLPADELSGLADVALAAAPQATIVVGSSRPDDTVARWAYQVRAAVGAIPVALFHRGTARITTTTGSTVLDESPSAAVDEVLQLIAPSPRQETTPKEGSPRMVIAEGRRAS